MDNDALQSIAAIIGGAGAVLTTVPTLIAAFRGRHGQQQIAASVRTLSFTTFRRSPWEGKLHWPANWDSVETRRRYWRRNRIGAWLAVLGLGAIAVVYLYIAASLEGPLQYVSYLVAALFGYGSYQGVIGLRLLHNVQLLDQTTLRGRSSTVTVAGREQDVWQFSFAALLRIGAQLISCEKKTGRIEAATGLWVPGIYHGERVIVQMYPDEDGKTFNITITSDNTSPDVVFGRSSNNERNIRLFIETWVFFPTSM